MDIYRLFDNLDEFWNFANKESNAYYNASRDNPTEWNGDITWEEACHLSKYGWVDGLKEIEKFISEIDTELKSINIKREVIFDDNGFAVDVGRYLSSEPECFYNHYINYDEKIGKVYKIVCSISVSAAIDPYVIIQKGAITACLIDTLERMGNRVELILNECTSSYDGNCEYDIIVKKAGESLQLIDLTFSLIHPAMLRRMVFSANEIDGWSDYTHGSYGQPEQASDMGDIYINEINSGVVSTKDAIQWIFDKLKELNIEINHVK